MHQSTLLKFNTAWNKQPGQRVGCSDALKPSAEYCASLCTGFYSATCGKVSVEKSTGLAQTWTEYLAALMLSIEVSWHLLRAALHNRHAIIAAAWVQHGILCRDERMSKGASWKLGRRSPGIMRGYSSTWTGTAFLHDLRSR